MNFNPQAILDYHKKEQGRMIDFLQKLITIESPSLEPATQEPLFQIFTKEFQELGYEVDRVKGKQTGGHILASPVESNPGNDRQLVIGHCDTVWPVGTLDKMPVEIKNGLIKGPGVFDMKAGLAQIIFSLRAIRDLKLEVSVIPQIMITSDEEIGSPESEPFITQIAAKVDRAFVLEPSLESAGQLKTARRGVGIFHVRVEGKAAHAGMDPEKGVSAILELSHVIQKLFQLNDPQKGISVNVGTIHGGLRTNMIAPNSEASVDVRIITAEDGKRIEETILNLQPTTSGIKLFVSGRIERGPMEKTPRNQALWQLAQKVGKEIGLELQEEVSGGASDGNITSLYTATLDGLGAVGGGAHAFHEFIDIEKTIERNALLTLLMISPVIHKKF